MPNFFLLQDEIVIGGHELQLQLEFEFELELEFELEDEPTCAEIVVKVAPQLLSE